MAMLTCKQGEAKTLTLTVTQAGAAVDLTDCLFFLGVKKSKQDTAYTFSKEDADFTKGQAAVGVIAVFLAADDTQQAPGRYVGELRISFPGLPMVIEKTADFVLEIEPALT